MTGGPLNRPEQGRRVGPKGRDAQGTGTDVGPSPKVEPSARPKEHKLKYPPRPIRPRGVGLNIAAWPTGRNDSADNIAELQGHKDVSATGHASKGNSPVRGAGRKTPSAATMTEKGMD